MEGSLTFEAVMLVVIKHQREEEDHKGMLLRFCTFAKQSKEAIATSSSNEREIEMQRIDAYSFCLQTRWRSLVVINFLNCEN